MSIQETEQRCEGEGESSDPTAEILFDQHSRYRVCADILEQLASGQPLRILDVGSGGECLLGQLMPGADITYVDPLLAEHPEPTEKMIAKDFFEAGFEARSFDFVVSIDFLEHIPADMRENFLRRSSELATRAVVLLCPCADTGEAAEVDRLISDSYQNITGQAYPWLVDHHELGLPLVRDVTSVFESLGWDVQRTANGHTPWLRDLLLPILCLWDQGARATAMELSKFFNREFFAYDNIPPCYRQVFVAYPHDQGLDLALETRTQMPKEMQQAWSRFRTRIMEASFQHLHREHHRALFAEQSAREAEQSAREAEQSAREDEQSAREAEQSAREAEQSAREAAQSATEANECLEEFLRDTQALLPGQQADAQSAITREERTAEVLAAITTLDEALLRSREQAEDLQGHANALQEELHAIKSSLIHRFARAVCALFDWIMQPFRRSEKRD